MAPDRLRALLPVPRGHQLALAGTFLVLAGCGGWRGLGNTYYAHRVPVSRARKETTYRFGMPGSGWRPVRDIKDVQVAWTRVDWGALIQVHAMCDDQGDSALHQYTDHLRIDWTEWTVHQQTPERLAGRAALRTIAQGRLDGVAKRNEFVVVKKNGCLFDFMYVADPGSFERGRADFNAVVQGFNFPLGGA